MDGRHPKRRKDKYNPYTLTVADGRFYLSFEDGQGVHHEMEINASLYRLLDRFELDDLSYLNEVDRHLDQTELSEALLSRYVSVEQEILEDAVCRSMQWEAVRAEIARLPEVQKRRLQLYFFDGLTYEEIAACEGCTVMPVKRSIDRALEKLRKIFGSRG